VRTPRENMKFIIITYLDCLLVLALIASSTQCLRYQEFAAVDRYLSVKVF